MQKKFLAAFFLFLLALSFASAKSFSLEKAEFNCKISSTGLAEVEEKMTVYFNGSFSEGFREIESEGVEISDIGVLVDGVPVSAKTGSSTGKLRIDWTFNALNETKIFTIKYKVKNAVEAYDDVAQFAWIVWGGEWGAPLKELYGTIELPAAVADPKDVYTYGHPSLPQGKIAITGNKTVIFQAFDIPANQDVGIRTVFPRKLLSSTENSSVKPGNGLQKIIKEEEKLSNESPAIFSAIPWPLLVGGPILLIIILFFLFWFLWGREPEVDYQGIYEHEPPYDYSPAVVSALINQAGQSPSNDSVLAVILDLCLKKFFVLEQVKLEKVLGVFGKDSDYKIILLDKALNNETSGLTKQEQIVFGWVKKYAKAKNEITLGDMQKAMSLDMGFASDYHEWSEEVKSEAKQYNFFGKNTGSTIFAIICILFIFLGFFLSINGNCVQGRTRSAFNDFRRRRNAFNPLRRLCIACTPFLQPCLYRRFPYFRFRRIPWRRRLPRRRRIPRRWRRRIPLSPIIE
ncbi:MAG: DUF2207 domain-containing protein [Candidatus Diapherotrites archaeon]|nr:DUF2207 domain-containing protein [Candidatus Diapherotrites archaeon]